MDSAVQRLFLGGVKKYMDEEGDLCTLTEHTFSDFLATAKEGVSNGQDVLKLEVVPMSSHAATSAAPPFEVRTPLPSAGRVGSRAPLPSAGQFSRVQSRKISSLREQEVPMWQEDTRDLGELLQQFAVNDTSPPKRVRTNTKRRQKRRAGEGHSTVKTNLLMQNNELAAEGADTGQMVEENPTTVDGTEECSQDNGKHGEDEFADPSLKISTDIMEPHLPRSASCPGWMGRPMEQAWPARVSHKNRTWPEISDGYIDGQTLVIGQDTPDAYVVSEPWPRTPESTPPQSPRNSYDTQQLVWVPMLVPVLNMVS